VKIKYAFRFKYSKFCLHEEFLKVRMFTESFLVFVEALTDCEHVRFFN